MATRLEVKTPGTFFPNRIPGGGSPQFTPTGDAELDAFAQRLGPEYELWRDTDGAIVGISSFAPDKVINFTSPPKTGGGAQAPQGQYITGPDGKVYYAAPYGGGLTPVGDIGVAPDFMPISNKRTGKSRLFDPNSGRNIDLGETDFPGIDPREIEGQRRLESDRDFAARQAEAAQNAAAEERRLELQERQFAATQDLENRRLGLQAANSLTTLAEAQESRKREILKGASDFIYRAFTQRGMASPQGQVTHADLINNLSGEFDRIASIYKQALTPTTQPGPLSSGGRLNPPQPYIPMQSTSPPVSAPPAAAPSIGPVASPGYSVPTYDENGNINGWGAPGGANTTPLNIPQAAPAAVGGGFGGGGFAPSAPITPAASRLTVPAGMQPVSMISGEGFGRFGDDIQPFVDSAPAPSTLGQLGEMATGGAFPGPGGGTINPSGLLDAVTGIGRFSVNNAKRNLRLGRRLLGFEDGGPVRPGEPAIVGEDGFEIIMTDPMTGETMVIPNDMAKRMVEKSGRLKEGGRLRGFEDGGFFAGWGGQDATAAINAFNAAKDASAGAYPSGNWAQGGAAIPSAPVAPSAPFAPFAPPQPRPQPFAAPQPQPNPGLQIVEMLQQLFAAKNPPVTQSQLQGDERRLRPPAIDAIYKDLDMPALRIPGNGDNPAPKIASRIALNKMTPDELLALNSSLGVAYNTTLDDYLAASDARFLAGAGQRRLRTAYR